MAEAAEAVETTVAGVADPANDPAGNLASNPAGILTILLMSRIPHTNEPHSSHSSEGLDQADQHDLSDDTRNEAI